MEDRRPVDPDRYAQLLFDLRPGIIEDPDERDRLLLAAEALLEKSDTISPEEEKLAALLVLLIEAYEASVEQDEEDEESSKAPPQPHETLARLMAARGLELGDVAPLFGNPHLAREALAGKRSISRNEAKQLARYFQVPPKLFHS